MALGGKLESVAGRVAQRMRVGDPVVGQVALDVAHRLSRACRGFPSRSFWYWRRKHTAAMRSTNRSWSRLLLMRASGKTSFAAKGFTMSRGVEQPLRCVVGLDDPGDEKPLAVPLQGVLLPLRVVDAPGLLAVSSAFTRKRSRRSQG